MRECRGGNNRRVLDAHAMVDFVTLFQSAQNRNCVLNIRLADIHNLKPPFQRRILLDVLPVLIQRRRANRPQVAASQRWLQHVRSVDCTLGSARADQGVQLVDEQNDPSLRVLYLFQYCFQPVFKFAAILRTG